METLRLVEPWERAAAGQEDDDALRPAMGMVNSMALALPIDLLLLVWVFA